MLYNTVGDEAFTLTLTLSLKGEGILLLMECGGRTLFNVIVSAAQAIFVEWRLAVQ